MALSTGQILHERYRIVKKLGEGGFGAVYRAWNMNLNGPCAIKENFETSPVALSQFAREASILYNLRHPNLPRVMDHFVIPEQGQYLVMEYIEGEDLEQKIDHQGGPLPEAQVMDWILQVCDALVYLHSRTPPIIHRDIKPANIRITPEGMAILVDFGIAKIFDPARRTTMGARAVTPGYSPYEQYGQKPTDVRTDVYALGATLYHALTAQVPPESIDRVGGTPLPAPRSLNPEISPGVEAAILRAMQVMAENRYQSAAEFKAVLAGARPHGGEAVRPAPAVATQVVGLPVAKPSQAPAPAAKAEAFPTGGRAPSVGVMPPTQAVSLPATSAAPARAGIPAPVSPPRKRGIGKGLLAVAAVIVFLACGCYLGLMVIDNMGWLQGAYQSSATLAPPPATAQNQAPPMAYQCTDDLGCVTVGPNDPIHIAAALVIAGPNESLGIDSQRGVEIAIADRGQVLGHAIRLTTEDTGCSAEGGQAAGTRLAADQTVVAVIGTSCSSEARVAMPLLSRAGFVVVSPSNTAPDLTEPGNPNNYPGYLRTAHNDEVQGAAAARFAWERLGVRKAATIHDGSLYADKLQQIFAQEFRKIGGDVTSQEAVDPNGTDFGPVLTRMASAGPQLIYFPVFLPAGGFIIRQARQTSGLEQTALMGADGLFSPDVVAAAGPEVEGFYVSSPFVSGPAYDGYVARYKQKFGQDPISVFHAHAYDAAMMIFAAIEKTAVRDADGTLHIPRQALRAAMYATRDFNGLTGLLTCTPTGDCASPTIAVYQYHRDTYPPVRIWP